MKMYEVKHNVRTNIWCPGLFARMVWQDLFNFYRKIGGNLDVSLDSLLCDLKLLENFFHAYKQQSIFWTVCPASGYTEITAYEPGDQYVATISYDPGNYLVTVTFLNRWSNEENRPVPATQEG